MKIETNIKFLYIFKDVFFSLSFTNYHTIYKGFSVTIKLSREYIIIDGSIPYIIVLSFLALKIELPSDVKTLIIILKI